MRISYENRVDTATALTALTEDLLYTDDSLQNQRLAKVYRSTDTSAQNIVVQLDASTYTVNTVAIIGHNFTTAATITIEANTSDSWGAPPYSTTLTALEDAMILRYLDSDEEYEFWRFVLDDTTITDSYIEIGRVWLGAKLDLSPTALLDFSIDKVRSDTVTHGRGRQKYATEGEGWRRFSLNFPRTKGTSLTNILTMIDTVGRHSSLIFSNFDTRRDYPIVEPVYCSIVDDVSFNHTRRMKFEYSLTLEEDR